MMPDKWDEVAKALCYIIRSNYHEQDVKAVSAALRNAYAEGERAGAGKMTHVPIREPKGGPHT